MMGQAVLKVPSEDLEWVINFTPKVFSCMRHSGLIFGSSIVEFLYGLL